MIHTNPIESFLLKFGETHFCYSREFKRARFLLASTTLTIYSSFYRKEVNKFCAKFWDHEELLSLFKWFKLASPVCIYLSINVTFVLLNSANISLKNYCLPTQFKWNYIKIIKIKTFNSVEFRKLFSIKIIKNKNK